MKSSLGKGWERLVKVVLPVSLAVSASAAEQDFSLRAFNQGNEQVYVMVAPASLPYQNHYQLFTAANLSTNSVFVPYGEPQIYRGDGINWAIPSELNGPPMFFRALQYQPPNPPQVTVNPSDLKKEITNQEPIEIHGTLIPSNPNAQIHAQLLFDGKYGIMHTSSNIPGSFNYKFNIDPVFIPGGKHSLEIVAGQTSEDSSGNPDLCYGKSEPIEIDAKRKIWISSEFGLAAEPASMGPATFENGTLFLTTWANFTNQVPWEEKRYYGDINGGIFLPEYRWFAKLKDEQGNSIHEEDYLEYTPGFEIFGGGGFDALGMWIGRFSLGQYPVQNYTLELEVNKIDAPLGLNSSMGGKQLFVPIEELVTERVGRVMYRIRTEKWASSSLYPTKVTAGVENIYTARSQEELEDIGRYWLSAFGKFGIKSVRNDGNVTVLDTKADFDEWLDNEIANTLCERAVFIGHGSPSTIGSKGKLTGIEIREGLQNYLPSTLGYNITKGNEHPLKIAVLLGCYTGVKDGNLISSFSGLPQGKKYVEDYKDPSPPMWPYWSRYYGMRDRVAIGLAGMANLNFKGVSLDMAFEKGTKAFVDNWSEKRPDGKPVRGCLTAINASKKSVKIASGFLGNLRLVGNPDYLIDQ